MKGNETQPQLKDVGEAKAIKESKEKGKRERGGQEDYIVSEGTRSKRWKETRVERDWRR